MRLRGALAGLSLALLFGLSAAPAAATWSIVAVDTETQEVGVASATCVTGLDLKAFLPVVVVGVGGGAAQSAVDGSGQRRQIMQSGFLNGLTAGEILTQLQALVGTASHQHGVAETGGTEASGTGASNGAHASGVTGSAGTLHYAIQGNVLTGALVVSEAESALLGTAGDLPERLMAAMEAARAAGGDGRCSCSPGSPTGCGAPPPSFTHAANVGFMILARYGDTDGAVCNSGGCARGDYFMDFNIANQGAGDPDPVPQMRGLFDAWRTGLEGRPDAIASTVGFANTAADLYTMTITLVDWRGIALGAPVAGVTVAHAPGSAGATNIGPVIDQGDGTYTVTLTRNGVLGDDLFEITVDDGVRPVVLPPRSWPLEFSVFSDGFEAGDLAAWSSTVP